MPELELLTKREWEVLDLVGQGRTNEQIADALAIEVTTVEQHLNHIFAKLGATSRIQAALKANILIYNCSKVHGQ
ncbi:MAG: helix-turn-helix transcriptional regulator [Caldilineaceae bacterium]